MTVDIKSLALATLYGTQIGPEGTCIRTNHAGMELAECDASALPIIEQLIREEVRMSNDEQVGLDHLIGAYMVIGVRANEPRVFDFLKRQSRSLQIEAINCASTFFFKTVDGEYNFGVTPNGDLVRFLNELASSDDREIALSAAEVCEEHSSCVSPPGPSQE